MDILIDTNEIMKKNYYSESVKRAQKKYYEKNKELKAKKSIDRYNNKCKDNQEYKEKKALYSKKRYQEKKLLKQNEN
jgi:hypothetical protein